MSAQQEGRTSTAPLAPGTVLLHIGPPKTGTTAIQGAFHTGRDSLARQRVHYAGQGRQPMHAAIGVAGRDSTLGDRAADLSDWDRLVSEVTHADADRVVVSSEFFADCQEPAIEQVVRELGPNVHVVVTLRPLWKILPSQWQQYVQNGMTTSYDGWLDAMFHRAATTRQTPSFWQRHRHDRLVERWAKVVGRDNLTVVVVDEGDREMLMRTFEQLLDLTTGTLVQVRDAPINRSLTLGEAEVLRAINAAFKDENWPDAAYARFLKYGAIPRIRAVNPRPHPDERITTPQWALTRAAEMGGEFAAAIDALGLRVIGDLAGLGAAATDPGAVRQEPADAPQLPASTAAEAILGVMRASGELGRDRPVRDRLVRTATSAELLRVVVGRFKSRARKAVGR